MDSIINSAWAAEQGGAGAIWLNMFILVFFFALIYFVLIVPNRKRQKEHTSMLSSLQKGDEILTSGGILGKISELGDNYVMLEVADGIVIKVQKHSVGALVPKGTFKSTM